MVIKKRMMFRNGFLLLYLMILVPIYLLTSCGSTQDMNKKEIASNAPDSIIDTLSYKKGLEHSVEEKLYLKKKEN